MTYTEKFTWGNKELIVKRETSPVAVVSAESQHVKLEKIDVADPRLRPTNFDKPEGTVLPILQAEGVRIDLSKRSKGDMTFWHRNMECDELIFCYQGGIRWETELGNVTLKPGELFIIPKGIAHRSMLPENSQGENIVIELKVKSEITRLV
jgi:homogentisate 1,2-dioxygenase